MFELLPERSFQFLTPAVLLLLVRRPLHPPVTTHALFDDFHVALRGLGDFMMKTAVFAN